MNFRLFTGEADKNAAYNIGPNNYRFCIQYGRSSVSPNWQSVWYEILYFGCAEYVFVLNYW